jgi:tetratricopeptide (TPR) repeat protein
MSKPTIFISYSHKDEVWKDRLTSQLGVLQTHGLLNSWDDRRIGAGEDWYEEIRNAIDSASIAVLLVSDNYLNSKFILDEEVKRLLQRRDEKGLIVFPVIVKHCPWQKIPWLSRMQARPKDGKPVEAYRGSRRSEILTNIATEIYERLEEIERKDDVDEMLVPGPINSVPLGPGLLTSLPVKYVSRRRVAVDEDLLEFLKSELVPTGSVNLFVLSGRGGVGKTAVAEEAVRALAPQYSNRVIWVDASDGEPPALPKVSDKIIRRLEPDPNKVPPAATEHRELRAAVLLKSGPTLIAIDDFERVSPQEQDRCIEWLISDAPRTVLLVARQAFLPNDAEQIGDREVVNEMTPSEAKEFWIRLVERHALHKHVFSHVSPEGVIEKYGRNPFILHKGVFTYVNTHCDWESVEEVIFSPEGEVARRVFQRSFELAGESGRRLLLALSLFNPHASRKDLAGVAGLNPSSKEFAESVRNLISLQMMRPAVRAGYFSMDKTDRAYTKEVMKDHPLSGELQSRFVECFARYVEQHAGGARNFELVEAEKEDIFEAMNIASTSGDRESFTKMFDILGRLHNGFFEIRGYWDAALKYCGLAIEAARALGDKKMLARFNCIMAGLHIKRSQNDAARSLLRPIIEDGGMTADRESYVNALHLMGMMDFNEHRYEKAREFFRRELEASEEIGDEKVKLRGIANCTQELGRIERLRGRFPQAREFYERSLETRKKLTNPDGTEDKSALKSSLHDLGLLAHQEGEWEQLHGNDVRALELYAKALSCYAKALRIKYEFKNMSSAAHTLTEAGDLARLLAQHAASEPQKIRLCRKARRRLMKSLEIKERLYDEPHAAFTNYILGRLALDQGDLSEAHQRWDACRIIRDKYGDTAGAAGCQYLAGLIEERRPDKPGAARLFRQALETWESLGLIATEYARAALKRVSDETS